MKQVMGLAMAVLAVSAAGCELVNGRARERAEFDTALVNWYHDAAVNNAIVSQRTLFPYHFVDNAGALNELGRRDLAVLAAHFVDNPGRLSVRRGPVHDTLYEARVHAVGQALAEAGVDPSRIAISDALPGGEGAASERVLTILAPPGPGGRAGMLYQPRTSILP